MLFIAMVLAAVLGFILGVQVGKEDQERMD